MDEFLFTRLLNQQLENPAFHTPLEIVRWMGAVQAQDYAGVKWAIGLRLPGATDAGIENAFNEGIFLRTHLMRPTWHFVTPTDIRWILDLTAARVLAVDAHAWPELNLDGATFLRCETAIADALRGGVQMTREELSQALMRAGIDAQGRRLAHVMMHAELDCVICSGPRRGKQFTYMLFDERVPASPAKPRQEALVELTRRYFTSHGPATVYDFAWWSGLTITDVKTALGLLTDELVSVTRDEKTYWQPREQRDGFAQEHRAVLLPPFDEYTVAYPDHSLIKDPRAAEPPVRPVFSGSIIVDGYLVGYWRRVFRGKTAVIELALLREITSDEREALTVASRRYADFLEVPVEVA